MGKEMKKDAEKGMELEEYLSNGVQKIVKGIIKASVRNPKTSIFMAKFSVKDKLARSLRMSAEQSGEHVPAFLIASITESCNLHCKGCYARANSRCEGECGTGISGAEGTLSAEQWESVFAQAQEIGIEFILLIGGEPFVRRDVLECAAKCQGILFPVFTNGTMIDAEMLDFLSENRNLMPVLSIEGNRKTTDARRGKGIYDKLQDTMERLHKKGILFGASVTVTKSNMKEVLSDEFVRTLTVAGVKAVVYVEYVPVTLESRVLALGNEDREWMMERLDVLRLESDDMMMVAFPGDENASGGCLAAGRGFFHINADGGAEPCPFSPYSDINVREHTLKEALQSPLFQKLKEHGNLTDEHIGGCTLFEHQAEVEALLGGELSEDKFSGGEFV